jgi:uroporphyrinogen-III synthase
MDFLRQEGAHARAVAPYRYADEADDAQVVAMIMQIAQRSVDAIAFTSKAQVERLFDVAQRQDALALLRQGLEHCRVAAIGPIVRDELEARGVTVSLMPDTQFYLKQLTEALALTLGPRQAE